MKISKKKFIADSLIYIFLPKVSVLASIIILPLISPFLTLEDYGLYGLILAYVSIFQIALILGQNVILQNSYFDYKNKFFLVWQRCFGIMTIGAILSSVIFFLILYFTLQSELKDSWLLVGFLITVFLVLSPLDTIAVSYFVLKGKSLPFAYGSALSGLIGVVVTFVCIRYFGLGYLGWIISLPVTALIKCLYYVRTLFFREKIFPVFNIKKRFWKKAIRIGLPLTPHQLSLYILGSSDRLLLQYFKIPVSQLGFYSQGYNFGSQSSILIGGIFQALSKNLQEGFRGREEYHRIFIRKLMIIIPLSISLVLFAGSLWTREIFFFLFRNPELRMSYPVTIVVISSYMYWSVYTFFTYPLSIKGKTFSISKISLTASAVNIAGNLIAIPLFGIWGALGTTYLSYMIFGIAGIFNKENREFLNRYINVTKLCFYFMMINLALFVAAFLTKDLNITTKLFVTLGVLSILTFSLLKLFPGLIAQLRRNLPN